jgi:Na+/melibiose symporter-like transporter
MNLSAARIVLGVIGGIILLINLGPIIQTIRITMANNAEPVFYIPVALGIVAAILSYMNIWERKLMAQPEQENTTTTTTAL